MKAVALAVLTAFAAFAVLAASSCGDDAEPGPRHASGSPDTSPTIEPQATPTEKPPSPTEFRVAFINLYSPISVDANNPVADETYDDRLQEVIDALRAFNPDLVGFNEATVTAAHGSAIARLAKELKMEYQYVRANPNFPGSTPEQNEALARQIGFEEGELVLSRYPILRWEPRLLNPRTSESGEVRAALHLVIKGPDTVGDVDVFITHLTGGGDAVRARQAADFVNFIAQSRGRGPVIAMVGQSDPSGESTYPQFSAIGLHDVAGQEPFATCCRESVLGEQPALTVRSDYLLYGSWAPASFQLFADAPKPRPSDGQLLYASDHNGIAAVFPVPKPDEPKIAESP